MSPGRSHPRAEGITYPASLTPSLSTLAARAVVYAQCSLERGMHAPHPERVEIPGMFHDLPLREMSSLEEFVHWDGRRLRLPVPARPYHQGHER